jgi:dihydroxyacetone kinase-like protein
MGTTAVPSAPVVDALAVRAYVRRCGQAVRRHAELLTRLDAVLGDGDHGDNLLIGFSAVDEILDADAAGTIGSTLSSVGTALVTSVGGASGPLYGAAFIEAGFAARAMDRIGVKEVAELAAAAAAALARRGRCRVGDKTIFDALAPAAEALAVAASADESMPVAIRRAVVAARHGMRSTRPLVARRGLAMRLGEASRGHLDPGAVSCFLLIRALVDPSPRDR